MKALEQQSDFGPSLLGIAPRKLMRAIKKAAPTFQVWSCGGGTQSIAIAALIVQGKLPKPDFAVIADTGRERSTTWKYLDSVLRPNLATVGVEIHRVHKDKFAFRHDDLFSLSGRLLIPAFSNISGDVGKMGNFCTKFWKIEAVDNWLSRVHKIKKGMRVKWIGFSINEANRALRMQRGEEYQRGLIRFPLIDDYPMDRAGAIGLVEEIGWPTPPRSNCWMCANQNGDEWLDLKNNQPEEFQRAVELEREIQKRDPNAWLHSSCVPLDQVEFENNDQRARQCDSGQCFL